jgi:hypothetical protein
MASVISVNVGLPRDMDRKGRLVHVAFWKRSVQGRAMALHLNLDGEGQAVWQGTVVNNVP